MTGQGLAGDRGGDGVTCPVMRAMLGAADMGRTQQRRQSSCIRGGAGGAEQGGGGGSRRGARARRARGWARLCVGRRGGVGGSWRRDLLATDGAAREIPARFTRKGLSRAVN